MDIQNNPPTREVVDGGGRSPSRNDGGIPPSAMTAAGGHLAATTAIGAATTAAGGRRQTPTQTQVGAACHRCHPATPCNGVAVVARQIDQDAVGLGQKEIQTCKW
ncbi:unnamed protein product [Macrosiphum euphorbiae]|uniref:Uncharacterized protein n=1 Tax=Macrosiphum euphorbiae TaxID=13131 RepID=A0AAV0Y8H7_9HEMI|nr:unnamed protein product [Macrosiphum euphorbiae]